MGNCSKRLFNGLLGPSVPMPAMPVSMVPVMPEDVTQMEGNRVKGAAIVGVMGTRIVRIVMPPRVNGLGGSPDPIPRAAARAVTDRRPAVDGQ